MFQHSRRILGTSVLAVLALASFDAGAHAGPLFVGGGYDYYAGPNDQKTQTMMATAGANLMVASFSLTGMRFDDDFVGKGNGVTAAVGFSAFPLTTMRLYGTRYIGDEDTFRAWRVKVGPQFGLPTGQHLGLYYSHYDEDNATSDGASAELEVPIVAGWTGRGAATYATSGGIRSSQGSLGLAWKPASMLEISTDVGFARNGGAASTQPFPSRPPIDLPLIGGGSGSPSTSDASGSTEATILAGLRFSFP